MPAAPVMGWLVVMPVWPLVAQSVCTPPSSRHHSASLGAGGGGVSQGSRGGVPVDPVFPTELVLPIPAAMGSAPMCVSGCSEVP